MPFITKADFEALIKNNVLDEVTDAEDAIIEQVSLMAQQEMESYLNQKYEVAQIFSATGNNRHKLIMMYAMDIALYHIHARVNPRYIPEIRQTRYDNAIKWLNSVAKGTITPDLPAKVNDDNELETNTRYGSIPKFNSDY